MKALLDEQLSPRIAALLRHRGHDVVAVRDRADLIGRSDRTILDAACIERRAVITNNVKDFRPLAAERLARGQGHGGLILLPSARARTRALVGHLADAPNQRSAGGNLAIWPRMSCESWTRGHSASLRARQQYVP